MLDKIRMQYESMFLAFKQARAQQASVSHGQQTIQDASSQKTN